MIAKLKNKIMKGPSEKIINNIFIAAFAIVIVYTILCATGIVKSA